MGFDPIKPKRLDDLDEEERKEIEGFIENAKKLLKDEDAFCTRCGLKLIGKRTENDLFIYCPQCGFIGHALLALPWMKKGQPIN